MSSVAFDEMDVILSREEENIKERLVAIAKSASAMNVSDEQAFKRLTSLYAESKVWEKKIESIRKEANAPEQAIINARNDRAKELLVPLRQIQIVAKQKSDGYMRLVEEKRRQEQEAIVEASALLGFEETLSLPVVEKSVKGDGAFVYTRVVRKFRTTDLAKVPLRYLQLNESLVEQDIKLGVEEIPGLEIYQENVTQLRTR